MANPLPPILAVPPPATLGLNRCVRRPIRPWPGLPTETQTQIAQLVAELVRRMHPVPPLTRESADADRPEPF
jgi:hypothetical protein